MKVYIKMIRDTPLYNISVQEAYGRIEPVKEQIKVKCATSSVATQPLLA